MIFKKRVEELLQQVLSCPDEQQILTLFKEVEKIMQNAATIKFLSHRVHKLYIRDNSPFACIELEVNGKIDYKKIYRLP